MVAFSVKEMWYTCFTQIRYLKDTQENSTILITARGVDLEVHIDAYFVGNWDLKETEDQDTAISRQVHIIIYAVCWHIPGLGEEFLTGLVLYLCVLCIIFFIGTVKLIFRNIYIYIYMCNFFLSQTHHLYYN